LVVGQVNIEFGKWLQRLWDCSGDLIVLQKDVDVVVDKQRPIKKIGGGIVPDKSLPEASKKL
jgi:hypothetical protein